MKTNTHYALLRNLLQLMTLKARVRVTLLTVIVPRHRYSQLYPDNVLKSYCLACIDALLSKCHSQLCGNRSMVFKYFLFLKRLNSKRKRMMSDRVCVPKLGYCCHKYHHRGSRGTIATYTRVNISPILNSLLP